MDQLSGASLSDWNEPLDLNLHVNRSGERRVPFALHVQPNHKQKLSLACDIFPQFCSLPLELQHRVIYFFDNATLFRLMQVSVTRREAKTLFWSDPDTWYRVHGAWVCDGGTPGNTFHDFSLLAYAERVVVSFDRSRLNPRDWTKPEHREEMEKKGGNECLDPGNYFNEATEQALHGLDEEIRQFWRFLRDLCPRLTDVLISARSGRRRPPRPLLALLARLVRQCPASVKVSAYLYLRTLSPKSYPVVFERSLWRLVDASNMADVENQWEKDLVPFTLWIVLLPPKRFHGPVGAFQQWLYRTKLRAMRENSIDILTVDSIERQHFQCRHEPFICFDPLCTIQFNAPGEFLQHARGKGHYCSATLLENIQALRDQYRRDQEKLLKEGSYQLYDQDVFESHPLNLKLLDYQKKVEPQRLLFRREYDAQKAFLYQLQHNPLYNTMKSKYVQELWDSFD